MLGYIFENRNSTLKSVIKLADCLGRSLRENVNLFSLDSENKKASFVTESGFVVDGTFSIDKNNLTLENIQVQNSKIFSDNESFNSFVSFRIKDFIKNIHESEYSSAEFSFDEIIDLWETRLQFNDVKKRLEEKSEAFSHTQNIITTPEFQQFLEIAPQVIGWLKENKEVIHSISEIKNAVKLSNSVSKAFDIPQVSISEMEKNKSITFTNGVNESIYDIICKQELVTKELLESKRNFDLVWANNKNINNLASLIYENDKNKISTTLVEALNDVPYLALATKKQLVETFNKSLQVDATAESEFSEKDIKNFVSIIFEMKKPVKNLLIKTINEKYGINVQNLKYAASFRGLAEAQIVIFESLSRLAPRSSVIKDVFGQVSKMLKEKSGVEVIDVNDILQALFEKAGYTSLCENYSISDKVTLKEMFESDLSAKEIIYLVESEAEKVADKIENLAEDATEGYPEKGIKGGTEAAKKEAKKKKKKKEPESEDKPDSPEEVQSQLSGKDAQYAEATEETSSEEEKKEEEGEESEEADKDPMSKEDFFKSLDQFSKILSTDTKKD